MDEVECARIYGRRARELSDENTRLKAENTRLKELLVEIYTHCDMRHQKIYGLRDDYWKRVGKALQEET